MENSYFYSNIEKIPKNFALVDYLINYSNANSVQTYLINKPLGYKKYEYFYDDVAVILIPNYKIIFVDYGNEPSEFQIFFEDFIEDLASISDKFRYKEIIGRPREWEKNLLTKYDGDLDKFNLDNKDFEIRDSKGRKISKLLISLLTGSINEIDRVKENIPDNFLDKVKQRIILFDGDQSRFIYDNPKKKIVTIQGLSGTGKTELLLHKIKDTYINDSSSKILFTCYTRILATNLKKRLPNFFDFMKVEQQILWNERLMVVHAWGSTNNFFSGAYRYICYFYKLPFQTFSYNTSFAHLCKEALAKIQEIPSDDFKYAFDYIFIDESQDFTKEFFELCGYITKENVYIAGDIFQSIFDVNIINTIKPDHLLTKCYRTDPKTLMFSHALGMGLFEDIKLRWLEEDDWKSCGYIVDRADNKYKIRREPINRFDDIETKIDSMEILYSDDNNNGNEAIIIDVIKKIKQEHPSVQPDDIAIIFIDLNKKIYQSADKLWLMIKQEFNWDVNKAYESKNKIENEILISNRNNVKGLEFPFVICITNNLSNSYSYRNALYTMLTRSFLKSYLIFQGIVETKIKEKLKTGLEQIIKNGLIEFEDIPDDEKNKIRTTFEQSITQMSLFDLFENICSAHKIDNEIKTKLFESYKALNESEYDREFISDWILTNYNLIMRDK